MITLNLPWPDAKLNPNRNKGLHWGATSALRKKARELAAALAREEFPLDGSRNRITDLTGDIRLSITFIQPDRRARDRDNLLAALKPSLDGIAEAIGVNDSRFDPVTIRRVYGSKPGSVLIEIGSWV